MSEEKAKDPLKWITPECRLSFPSLFKPSKPKAAPAEQEPKYNCALLFKKDEDLSGAKAAVKHAIKEKWGDDVPKDLRLPFRDQGEQDYEGYEEGAVFINCSSKKKPGIVDAKLRRIEDEEEMYPGANVRASLRAFAYGGKGTGIKPGVAFGLQNIQKLNDKGEPLGGRAKPEDEFEAIEGVDDVTTLDDLLD